jgi:hypothetical protein
LGGLAVVAAIDENECPSARSHFTLRTAHSPL